MQANDDRTGRRHRRWAMVWLALILVTALGLRYRGIDWPKLHPDEGTIASWADWIERHHAITQRLYAGGFFQTVKPVLQLRSKLEGAAVRWHYFEGSPDAATSASPVPMIPFLREFNVWLATATVLVFYLLAYRVTRHRAAALAAAAFLAWSRLHVEHSHYAETDIAMLAMLSLSLYLWVRVCDGARLGWFLAAAFMAGWAIGTKFTLAILVVNTVAGAFMAARTGVGSRQAGRIALFVVTGLILCLAGLLYTNPGLMDPDWFVPQAKHCLSAVYAERSLNAASRDPWVGIIMNWGVGKAGMAGLGWGWLPFLAAGLAGSFLPAYRRFWPATLLFPALYAIYFVLVAPWVRGQEFLAFYPVFAVWIAIGVCEAMAWARRTARPRVAVMAVTAVVAAAAGASALPASRMAGLFGWPDPRLQALQWLQKHAPLEVTVGTEGYTEPVSTFFGKTEDLRQIEWIRTNELTQRRIDYVIRNVPIQGRGSVDPRTLRLYPDYARNLKEFQTYARRLCQWGPMGETALPFAGHPIEWWETRPCDPKLTLNVPLFRPVSLDESVYVCVPGEGTTLGSSAGAVIDRNCRSLVVNGPGRDDRTLWVVLQTSERPAEVMIAGLGCRRKAALAPYDVDVVTLKRPRWLPRLDPYDIVGVHAEPLSHIEYIPCFVEIAFSAEEAALRLYEKGYPDRALALLKGTGRPVASWLTYASAVAVGDWALADALSSEAQGNLDRFERARHLPSGALLVNGCSGTGLRDFRRLRPMPPAVGNDGQAVPVPALEARFREQDPPERGWESTLALPVRLSPGRYDIRFTLEEDPPRCLADAWPLTLHDNVNTRDEPLVITPGRQTEVTRSLVVEREQDLALTLGARHRGANLKVPEFEIRWDTDDLFWPERRELYRALVRHALHRGEPGAAIALLQAASETYAADAELLRLKLQALVAASPDSVEAVATARQIVAQAPGYVPALEVLAAGDETSRERRAVLERGAPLDVVFYPWLKLVRLDHDASTGHKICCFEVLRDQLPPLKVRAIQGQRHGAYFERPVSTTPLWKGECVRIDVPPPSRGGWTDVHLAVDTHPDWLGGPLRIAGSGDTRLRLDR